MNTKNIVVCDDDSAFVSILKTILGKKQGFNVSVAINGEDGLSLVQQLHPCLFILDFNMPGKDGLSVLQDMKDMPAPRPYTILLSANVRAEVHAQAKALGADEIMIKPFKPADLLSKIDDLVAKGKI
jgi:CheY-like chemotaxis protein